MSDSVPSLKVHPPNRDDRPRNRGEGGGDGEETTEEVRAEGEHAPVPFLSGELTSISQLRGAPQHGATEKEDGEEQENQEEEKEEEEGERGREKDAGAEAEAEGEGVDGGVMEVSRGISKVQSVFALVRSRVRSQSSAERPQGRGLLGVVQQATWDLVRAQGGRPAAEPSQEEPSGAEQGSREGDDRGSTVVMETGCEGEGTAERDEDLEVKESKGEGTGGEEVLRSMEALRQELKEEITRLRLDTQQALAGLEARLTHSLRIHGNGSATLAKQPATADTGSGHGGAERRRRPPTIAGPAAASAAAPVPLGHAVRRRALYRTLTTLTSTTCPPPPLLPRSRSEPMGGSFVRHSGNGADAPGRLPPRHQHSRKPLRSKTCMLKPDSG